MTAHRYSTLIVALWTAAGAMACVVPVDAGDRSSNANVAQTSANTYVHDGTPADSGNPAGGQTQRPLDADGVEMLFDSAPGSSFRLGEDDPNHAANLVIEGDQTAAAKTENNLHFWRLNTYPLDYGSGGSGVTARLLIHASGGDQRFTWKNQKGFLASATDLRNQELTVYVRVHSVVDPEHAGFELKVRGGRHTSSAPDDASCVEMTFNAATTGAVTSFAKELTHPIYDFVKLTPKFDASLKTKQWVGLKLVSYNVPNDASRVVNRLYLDVDPFDVASAKPKNNWQLFSEYVDIQGKDTGNYSKLVNWGGWETTVRIDGVQTLDFALVSAREIVAPSTP